MNNEELRKKVDRLIEKIEFPPNRDRECLYCGKSFYAHNLSQLSCSENCYQSYYNERKRPLKELEKLLAKLKAEQDAMDEIKRSQNTHENIHRRNIEIIDQLTIDPLVGTQYDEDTLTKLGIDFAVYDFREKVPNTLNSFELVIGTYRLTLIDPKKLLIKNNSQQ